MEDLTKLTTEYIVSEISRIEHIDRWSWEDGARISKFESEYRRRMKEERKCQKSGL